MRHNVYMLPITGLLIFLLASCHSAISDNRTDCPDVQPRDLKLYAAQSNWLRAADTKWNSNDEMGVYALKHGEALAVANLFDNYGNVQYSTTEGDGKFAAVGAPITLTATQQVDLIAYYPYSSDITVDYKYNFNASDQSKQKSFDLLYSNNAKQLDNVNNQATLTFTHQLTKLILTVNLHGATATTVEMGMDEVYVDGFMNLVDGNVTTGTTKASVLNASTIDAANNHTTILILPPQSLKDKVIRLKVDGVDYVVTFKEDVITKSGFEYKIQLEKVASTPALRVVSATILPWNVGGTYDVGAVEEEGGATPPTPNVIEVESITITPSAATVEEGKSITLIVAMAPDNVTDKSLTWTSDKPEIATVDNGVVTGKAVGTAVITATSKNGKTATTTITVKAKSAEPSVPEVPGENL